jgi:hypothetical protein
MENSMPILTPGQREDFDAVVKSRRRSPDEFEIHERQHPMVGADVQPVRGQVEVRDTGSGVVRTYQAGHGTSWVFEFEKDLAAGLFAKR